jgi:hypothetical protein
MSLSLLEKCTMRKFELVLAKTCKFKFSFRETTLWRCSKFIPGNFCSMSLSQKCMRKFENDVVVAVRVADLRFFCNRNIMVAEAFIRVFIN